MTLVLTQDKFLHTFDDNRQIEYFEKVATTWFCNLDLIRQLAWNVRRSPVRNPAVIIRGVSRMATLLMPGESFTAFCFAGRMNDQFPPRSPAEKEGRKGAGMYHSWPVWEVPPEDSDVLRVIEKLLQPWWFWASSKVWGDWGEETAQTESGLGAGWRVGSGGLRLLPGSCALLHCAAIYQSRWVNCSLTIGRQKSRSRQTSTLLA